MIKSQFDSCRFYDSYGHLWKLDKFVSSGAYGMVYTAACAELTTFKAVIKLEALAEASLFREISLYNSVLSDNSTCAYSTDNDI